MKIHFNYFFRILAAALILSACAGRGNETKDNPKSTSGINMLSDAKHAASCVFLTNDLNGNPAISWTETDSAGKKYFYFARWNDSLDQFISPVSIPIEQNAAIHEEGMPKIAFRGDGSLFAMYETSVQNGKSKWGFSEINYIRSFDNGKTWTAPSPVFKNNIHQLSCSFANLCRLGDGEIGVTWLGTNAEKAGMAMSMARPIEFARTNGNSGFGDPVLIEAQGCQCCRTAISSDPKGNVIIAFRGIQPGSVRDVCVSASSDNGKTFSRSNQFDHSNWAIDGCPHNGPCVVEQDGKTFVTWYSGGKTTGVHYAELNNSGKIIDQKNINRNGRFIQLCVLADGSRITAYNQEYREGDSNYSRIVVNKINDEGIFQKEIFRRDNKALYPVVTGTKDGRVIVAWKDQGHIYYDILNPGKISEIAPVVPDQKFSLKTKLEE